MRDGNITYHGLANSFYWERMTFGDYLWKSEDIIPALEEEEIRKTRAYFPDHPDLRIRKLELEVRVLKTEFPRFINYSSFLMAVAINEAFLHRICTEEERKRKLRISVKDFGGQGLRRIVSYLDKVCSVQVPKLKNQRFFEDLILIRNTIAHSYGVMQHMKNETDIRRILARDYVLVNRFDKVVKFSLKEHVNLLNIDGLETLAFRKDFVYYAFYLMADFTESVFSELGYITCEEA